MNIFLIFFFKCFTSKFNIILWIYEEISPSVEGIRSQAFRSYVLYAMSKLFSTQRTYQKVELSGQFFCIVFFLMVFSSPPTNRSAVAVAIAAQRNDNDSLFLCRWCLHHSLQSSFFYRQTVTLSILFIC